MTETTLTPNNPVNQPSVLQQQQQQQPPTASQPQQPRQKHIIHVSITGQVYYPYF